MRTVVWVPLCRGGELGNSNQLKSYHPLFPSMGANGSNQHKDQTDNYTTWRLLSRIYNKKQEGSFEEGIERSLVGWGFFVYLCRGFHLVLLLGFFFLPKIWCDRNENLVTVSNIPVLRHYIISTSPQNKFLWFILRCLEKDLWLKI